MANANFNTEILSSTKKGEELSYNLDNVIDKDFIGPYFYDLGSVPFGVNVNRNTLIIPPNLEFDLTVKVYNENDKPIEAVANTKVVLDKISFDKEKEKFLENESLVKNLSETKGEWAKIINRSTDKKVDGDVKTPDTVAKYIRYGAARPIN